VRVVVAGGTGFLGVPLCTRLVDAGHQVWVLTRDVRQAARTLPSGVEPLQWDAKTLGPWTTAVQHADGVVNFAGTSLADGRWTPERKAILVASRLDATRALVQAMAETAAHPAVLISASAIGYYGFLGDEVVTESHDPGDDFLARLCVSWEEAAQDAEALGVRVVRARVGIVLSRHGGALERLLTPFRFGVGGPLGSGKQWYSWIHRDDVLNLILFALEHAELRGAMNVTAPEPARMRDLARELGRALHRPSLLPVPKLALRLLVGEFADALVTGQRVVPSVAKAHGFTFTYPTLRQGIAAALAE
jgi:uncharacterized protein (TIGR01777 family)